MLEEKTVHEDEEFIELTEEEIIELEKQMELELKYHT